MLKSLQESDVGAANKSNLQAMLSTVQSYSTPEECHQLCRYVHSKACYKESEHKIIIIFEDSATRKLVTDSLAQLGFSHKTSRAPASPIEDELEKLLQALEI